MSMHHFLKNILNRICQVIVLPLAFLCWVEERIARTSETIFHMCTHIMAILPGLPGVFLRRAFYSLTLSRCSLNCHIGFGSLFTHRNAVVEDHVYMGVYCIIGSARLRKKTLIGSRVSIVSGKEHHSLDAQGEWTPFDPRRITQVTVGPNVWVGEGALIMDDVGEGSLVGAGAVVSSRVRAHVVVAGNPARFIRVLRDPGTS